MIYNEIAEQGQLSQILQRRLNMLGAAPAPALMPEVAPCLILENDRPEWSWLKGERRLTRVISVAAAVGSFSSSQLYLPSNTRNIAVVTEIRVLNANTTSVSRLVGISGGLAGWAAYSTTSADFRWNAQGSSVLCETIQNAAQPANNGALTRFTANGQAHTQPIIIAPNTSLGIYGDAVNTALLVSVSWYERPALPGELV